MEKLRREFMEDNVRRFGDLQAAQAPRDWMRAQSELPIPRSRTSYVREEQPRRLKPTLPPPPRCDPTSSVPPTNSLPSVSNVGADAPLTPKSIAEPVRIPSVTTKDWTLSTLLQKSKHFQQVPRVSWNDKSWIAMAEECERQGIPLIIEDWHTHPRWSKAFDADWLVCQQGDDVLSARNLGNYKDTDMTLGDFVEYSRTTSQYSVEDKPLYAKDVDCPKIWRDWLHSDVLPSDLRPGGSKDLLKHLPPSEQVETIMCYYGIGDTFTPCHKDLCGSTGHNLMCHTENGSSFWFLTASDAAPEVAKYFQDVLKQELDWENHVTTVDDLKDAPFMVYVAEQKLGDLILIPPRSCHQVINHGGLTMKLSWSRMTLKGLTTALLYELPIYRRVCRPEIYRVKSVLYHSLRYYADELAAEQEAGTKQVRRRIGDAATLNLLVPLFDAVLREEYGELTSSANDDCTSRGVSVRSNSARPTPSSLLNDRAANDKDQLSCDFCGADIFQSYFKCDECCPTSVASSQYQGGPLSGYRRQFAESHSYARRHCFMHLLDMGVHSSEAFLSIKGTSWKGGSEWHQQHLKAKLEFANVKPALMSVEKTGLFAPQAARHSARLVLAALNYRRCRAVNRTFTKPGFYDFDVTSIEVLDGAAPNNQESNAMEVEFTTVLGRPPTPTSVTPCARSLAQESAQSSRVEQVQSEQPAAVVDVTMLFDESPSTPLAFRALDAPADTRLVDKPSPPLSQANRAYILLPTVPPVSTQKKRTSVVNRPSKRQRTEAGSRDKEIEHDWVEDDYGVEVVGAYRQVFQVTSPKRKRLTRRIDSPEPEPETNDRLSRVDQMPREQPSGSKRLSGRSQQPECEMKPTGKTNVRRQPSQPFPMPTIATSSSQWNHAKADSVMQSPVANTTECRVYIRGPRGKPPGKRASGFGAALDGADHEHLSKAATSAAQRHGEHRPDNANKTKPNLERAFRQSEAARVALEDGKRTAEQKLEKAERELTVTRSECEKLKQELQLSLQTAEDNKERVHTLEQNLENMNNALIAKEKQFEEQKGHFMEQGRRIAEQQIRLVEQTKELEEHKEGALNPDSRLGTIADSLSIRASLLELLLPNRSGYTTGETINAQEDA
ncbi:hypothetical protein DAEQUDRAFT_738881 [Daedalea quercina L-15889]|uniref:JmjC domain-containing protein n=1 Tax=Daedalea quercina L-15889 TaxID=1314783 RepID=A0A165PEY4_9APHY|nr:hypothetical protein DAEQUDRAFT_738881 [Daedalea quercina L-15889]